MLSIAEISRCAMEYCGSDLEISGPAISESATLLKEKFNGLALDEVREAFMLAASKQIDANLAAYSGLFTVRLFGEVMAAYVEFRRPIYAELIKRIEAEKKAVQDAEISARNATTRQGIIDQFTAMRDGHIEPFKSIDSIPAIWIDVLVDEMLIFGSVEVWIKAKRTVVNRFISAQSIFMPDETISSFDSKRIYYALKQNPNIFPSELKPRAIGLYGRMLIWNEINNR